jgi:cytochrome c
MDTGEPVKLEFPSPVMALLICAALAAATPSSAEAADPARGKSLYQGCNACHSIDDNDIGPRHRGVVGRRAGTIADYNYSPALKASGLTWDSQTLDRWLTNPSELVPGTKMFFKLDSAQDRADVIAYLEQLK